MADPSTIRSRRFALREIVLTSILLIVTTLATLFLASDTAATLTASAGRPGTQAQIAVFLLVVGSLAYGNIVYHVTRIGYFIRRLRHRPDPLESFIDRHWDTAGPIAILVPSYKEDERTIRQTLLSAALQHHPNTRVVLLLDDPPVPQDRESARMLARALRMPTEITLLLSQPRRIVHAAMETLASEGAESSRATRPGIRTVLRAYEELVAWLDACERRYRDGDHTDRHFAKVTFAAHRRLIQQRARSLTLELADNPTVRQEDLLAELRRLSQVFSTEISVFQRKRYRNLSHEPNKASNLNAYIGLIGTSNRVVRKSDGLHLEPTSGAGPLTIPDATYILTLDADSMLAPDYALRLASVFEAPGNDRVAVVQSPYTAIPRAPGVLERIAGATTDIQYIVHQGFTWCGATFWVGANALLRKAALEDIRTEERVGDVKVQKFIQDRTVIEDTESTIDLADQGWQLHNYPERMAWSATPRDFGSLLIQRSRWANGGLLILPKLVTSTLRRPSFRGLTSFFVRMHYLTSIATGSLGLLLLIVIPLNSELDSVWLPVAAAPYFALYARDLAMSGYRARDLLRVYAFNLMLVPVNLAGVLKSLHQGLTGKRTPFGRTPKVADRTAAPRWAVLSTWAALAWCVVAAALDAYARRWLHASFSMMTASGLAYAIMAFIGIRESMEDALRGLPVPIPIGNTGPVARANPSRR